MRDVWWGSFGIGVDGTLRTRIASLSLWVHRTPREWRLAWDWPAEWARSLVEFEREEAASLPDDGASATERHVVATGDRVELLPATADRPVVSSPRVPFFLGPREEASLYIGSPLWARIRDPAAGTLRELPIHRPSDTFFGPSTMEGELCFATRSRAALELDNVEWSARRATTLVRIRNRSRDALPVERIKIPVTMLSIYAAGSDLWTEGVDVLVEEPNVASVTVRPGCPVEAKDGELLTPARDPVDDEGLIMRVFDDLVSMTRKL